MTRIVLVLMVLPFTALAEMTPRDGWVVLHSAKSHADLADATRAAIGAVGLVVVT